MKINSTFDTARTILASATFESKANAFGSIGELAYALHMAEKWGGESWTRALAQALSRIASQRGIDAGSVFVWDEVELSHKINPAALQKTCDALLAS